VIADWLLTLNGLREGSYIIIAVAINLLSVWLMGWRYKIFLGYLKERISLLNSFWVICTAQFANYITPLRAGNVAIRPIASEMFAGVSSWKSLLATVFELVIDTSWQIVLVSLILLLVAENQLLDSLIPKVTIVGTFLLVIMLGLVYHRELINWILQQRKFFPGKIDRIMAKFELQQEKMEEISNQIVQYISNMRLFLLSSVPVVINILLQPLLLQYSGKAFSMSLTYFSSFTIFWISFIVGRLSGIPGGLGLGDISMGGLLIKAGVAPFLVLKVIILYRIVTMVFPHVLIGGPLFFILSKRMALRGIAKLE